MSYFRELPDLEYQSFLNNNNSSGNYIKVKNIFRRVKLRDDLHNVITIFNKYTIKDGARPELVAEELYEDAELDWVVLLTAGITNIRDQWPLSNRDLFRYSEQKYGAELNAVRFYETKEVKDSEGRLILPEGKVVSEFFTIKDPLNKTDDINPVRGISNYEYEIRKNNKKSQIYVLKREYLQQYLNDMRDIMNYTPSSQFIDNTLIRTENTRISSP
jgi:hypothetical protein